MFPFEREHRQTPKNVETLPKSEIFCDKTMLTSFKQDHLISSTICAAPILIVFF